MNDFNDFKEILVGLVVFAIICIIASMLHSCSEDNYYKYPGEELEYSSSIL